MIYKERGVIKVLAVGKGTRRVKAVMTSRRCDAIRLDCGVAGYLVLGLLSDGRAC